MRTQCHTTTSDRKGTTHNSTEGSSHGVRYWIGGLFRLKASGDSWKWEEQDCIRLGVAGYDAGIVGCAGISGGCNRLMITMTHT